MSIKEKALKFLKEGRVKKELETGRRIYFKVRGETEEYSVIYDKQRKRFECDCPFHSLKGKECSHILAVKLYMKIKE